MNTKEQGAIGVAAAVLYFTKNSRSVSLPVSDIQRYDLIFDSGFELSRVECKTTSYIRNGKFEVNLATAGGNQSWNGLVKNISSDDSDYVFIYTTSGDCYVIPTEVLDGMGSATLGSKYDRYKVA